MKRILTTIIILFTGLCAAAQIANPVQWNYTAKKIADKTFEIHMTATIQGGKYHIYAQNNSKDGPVPTSFTFTKNPLLTLTGTVKEVGKMVSKFEEVFGFKVNYYENKVDFVQLVKTRVTAPVTLGGQVEYMVCDDKQCLPPKQVPFSIKLGGS
ncbi:MAG: protein-disulfide reductase DsbD domain-containing protein [Ferruginibacter sp.]